MDVKTGIDVETSYDEKTLRKESKKLNKSYEYWSMEFNMEEFVKNVFNILKSDDNNKEETIKKLLINKLPKSKGVELNDQITDQITTAYNNISGDTFKKLTDYIDKISSYVGMIDIDNKYKNSISNMNIMNFNKFKSYIMYIYDIIWKLINKIKMSILIGIISDNEQINNAYINISGLLVFVGPIYYDLDNMKNMKEVQFKSIIYYFIKKYISKFNHINELIHKLGDLKYHNKKNLLLIIEYYTKNNDLNIPENFSKNHDIKDITNITEKDLNTDENFTKSMYQLIHHYRYILRSNLFLLFKRSVDGGKIINDASLIDLYNETIYIDVTDVIKLDKEKNPLFIGEDRINNLLLTKVVSINNRDKIMFDDLLEHIINTKSEFGNVTWGHIKNMFLIPMITRLNQLIKKIDNYDSSIREGKFDPTENNILTYVKLRYDNPGKKNKRYKISTKQDKYLEIDVLNDSNDYYRKDKIQDIFDKKLFNSNKNKKDTYHMGPFTGIFTENPSQLIKSSSKNSFKDLTDSLISGKNVSVLMYGTSGSGKTSTVIRLKYGNKLEEGIVPLLCNRILSKYFSQINISFYEIMKDPHSYGNEHKIKPDDCDGKSWCNDFYKPTKFNFTNNEFSTNDFDFKDFNEKLKKNHPDDYDEHHFENINISLSKYLVSLLETQRLIQPTINNPVSSRSHLLIDLELIRSENFDYDNALSKDKNKINIETTIENLKKEIENQKKKIESYTKKSTKEINTINKIKSDDDNIKELLKKTMEKFQDKIKHNKYVIQKLNDIANSNNINVDILKEKLRIMKFENELNTLRSNEEKNEENKSKEANLENTIAKLKNAMSSSEISDDIEKDLKDLLEKEQKMLVEDFILRQLNISNYSEISTKIDMSLSNLDFEIQKLSDLVVKCKKHEKDLENYKEKYKENVKNKSVHLIIGDLAGAENKIKCDDKSNQAALGTRYKEEADKDAERRTEENNPWKKKISAIFKQKIDEIFVIDDTIKSVHGADVYPDKYEDNYLKYEMKENDGKVVYSNIYRDKFLSNKLITSNNNLLENYNAGIDGKIPWNHLSEIIDRPATKLVDAFKYINNLNLNKFDSYTYDYSKSYVAGTTRGNKPQKIFHDDKYNKKIFRINFSYDSIITNCFGNNDNFQLILDSYSDDDFKYKLNKNSIQDLTKIAYSGNLTYFKDGNKKNKITKDSTKQFIVIGDGPKTQPGKGDPNYVINVNTGVGYKDKDEDVKRAYGALHFNDIKHGNFPHPDFYDLMLELVNNKEKIKQNIIQAIYHLTYLFNNTQDNILLTSDDLTKTALYKVCTDRNNEGLLINDSLSMLRGFISAVMKEKKKTPDFLPHCLPLQCNPLFNDCFGNTLNNVDDDKGGVIIDTIKRIVAESDPGNNIEVLKDMVFCVINVFNGSEPKPITEIDEKTGKEIPTGNLRPTDPFSIPFIDISLLTIDLLRMMNYNKVKNIDGLNHKHASREILKYFYNKQIKTHEKLLETKTNIETGEEEPVNLPYIKFHDNLKEDLNSFNLNIFDNNEVNNGDDNNLESHISILRGIIKDIEEYITPNPMTTMAYIDSMSKFALNKTLCLVKPNNSTELDNLMSKLLIHNLSTYKNQIADP